jgi:hypothetical protein
MSGLVNLLSDELHARVNDDPLWRPYLADLDPVVSHAPFGVHLAIFVEPYLEHVLAGRKTVESRFSIRPQAPYRAVSPGDVLLLKRSGGPIVGLCRVSEAWFYRLDPATWSSIRRDFAEELCAQDPAFWEARAGAEYATLLRIVDVRRISALTFDKRDRRGWVVMRQRNHQSTLGF